ncbi:MAG TPA: hypothetical protein GX521_05755 [Firmicutes bacterium]|nr:hypothetical protein [Bacillota bacterium]
MKNLRLACLGLLTLFFVLAAANPGMANETEFKKTFLLETGARYEVSVQVRSKVQNASTIASVYITGEHGEYLRSTQISGRLARTDRWETISTIVTAPPGALRATVIFTAPEGVEMKENEVNIRRVELDLADEELIRQGLVYTGLIVDGRGLQLQRGMSPKIYSESGQLIYAGVAVAYDFLQQSGIAAYGQELSPELLRRIQPHKSVTISPLVIRALEVAGSAETSVIISDEDAQAILAALNIYDFLAEYSVVFLID